MQSWLRPILGQHLRQLDVCLAGKAGDLLGRPSRRLVWMVSAFASQHRPLPIGAGKMRNWPVRRAFWKIAELKINFSITMHHGLHCRPRIDGCECRNRRCEWPGVLLCRWPAFCWEGTSPTTASLSSPSCSRRNGRKTENTAIKSKIPALTFEQFALRMRSQSVLPIAMPMLYLLLYQISTPKSANCSPYWPKLFGYEPKQRSSHSGHALKFIR